MNCYPKGITSKYCIVYNVKVDEHDIYCSAICPAGFPWEWTKWRRAVRNAKKTYRKIACEFFCEDTGNRLLVEVEPILGRGLTLELCPGELTEPHVISKNRMDEHTKMATCVHHKEGYLEDYCAVLDDWYNFDDPEHAYYLWLECKNCDKWKEKPNARTNP